MDDNDDQGLQWWAELGQHEVAEFTEWLDKVDEPHKEQDGKGFAPISEPHT